jgi:hypothetical protein
VSKARSGDFAIAAAVAETDLAPLYGSAQYPFGCSHLGCCILLGEAAGAHVQDHPGVSFPRGATESSSPAPPKCLQRALLITSVRAISGITTWIATTGTIRIAALDLVADDVGLIAI